MRTIQLSALGLCVLVLLSGWLMLSGLEPEAPASAAGGVGLFFLGVLFPLLCISACLSVPSTVALLLPGRRVRYGMDSILWRGVLGLNVVLSLVFLAVALAAVAGWLYRLWAL
ncbi:hypothetical protein [Ferrimonas balearica]|uniref:hypothetical protein n=1 Tax=Ferrimonas balearica TaxID=44012 RepID=UPI001C9A0340|nr:hypothetical protein [Ferrimonas balearica]MBY5991734.1 hypothetical protein [Ferrimonas balearica]